MFRRLGRYWRTIKFLKPVQILFLIKLQFDKTIRNPPKIKSNKIVNSNRLVLTHLPHEKRCYLGNLTFDLQNIKKQFHNKIDWNFLEYGQLWAYNLNYFEYLNQENIKVSDSLSLIKQWNCSFETNTVGLDPYPTSVRAINWIKFISKYDIIDNKINNSLLIQYSYLLKRLEYHLLTNHLLENAFSLLYGAYFFNDQKLFNVASKVLRNELKSQVLNDGGHCEVSPMYHQWILHRLLESNYLVENNPIFDSSKLHSIFQSTIANMLGWLNLISFRNGDIPCFNDSVNGVAPTTQTLNTLASKMYNKPSVVKLSDSGYRKFQNEYFQIIVDVGGISPSYQPGHSHSDTFSFVLYHKDQPIIVDPGVSTYETGRRRCWERSTEAHNTVVVNNSSQSEMWGSFRVGKRVKVYLQIDDEDLISAYHNGYAPLCLHQREFYLLSSGTFQIKDTLKNGVNACATWQLHLHPNRSIRVFDDSIFFDTGLVVKVDGKTKISVEKYQYAIAFNSTISSTRIVGSFRGYSSMTFY